ncbi:hypothetical protein FRB97_002713 [Tulasnella sp. 331]|nr:hypothetical protein FRB97_002713 [Tulasnella sp. 331]KAG8883952.1 hypothetical protein FRB98_002733 [Tulasnella sp. 332]
MQLQHNVALLLIGLLVSPLALAAPALHRREETSEALRKIATKFRSHVKVEYPSILPAENVGGKSFYVHGVQSPYPSHWTSDHPAYNGNGRSEELKQLWTTATNQEQRDQKNGVLKAFDSRRKNLLANVANGADGAADEAEERKAAEERIKIQQEKLKQGKLTAGEKVIDETPADEVTKAPVVEATTGKGWTSGNRSPGESPGGERFNYRKASQQTIERPRVVEAAKPAPVGRPKDAIIANQFPPELRKVYITRKYDDAREVREPREIHYQSGIPTETGTSQNTWIYKACSITLPYLDDWTEKHPWLSEKNATPENPWLGRKSEDRLLVAKNQQKDEQANGVKAAYEEKRATYLASRKRPQL